MDKCNVDVEDVVHSKKGLSVLFLYNNLSFLSLYWLMHACVCYTILMLACFGLSVGKGLRMMN